MHRLKNSNGETPSDHAKIPKIQPNNSNLVFKQTRESGYNFIMKNRAKQPLMPQIKVTETPTVEE